jgi:hypothetical protein
MQQDQLLNHKLIACRLMLLAVVAMRVKMTKAAWAECGFNTVSS